jgi:hypothetical protein
LHSPLARQLSCAGALQRPLKDLRKMHRLAVCPMSNLLAELNPLLTTKIQGLGRSNRWKQGIFVDFHRNVLGFESSSVCSGVPRQIQFRGEKYFLRSAHLVFT